MGLIYQFKAADQRTFDMMRGELFHCERLGSPDHQTGMNPIEFRKRSCAGITSSYNEDCE
jgi:hypothetical protein